MRRAARLIAVIAAGLWLACGVAPQEQGDPGVSPGRGGTPRPSSGDGGLAGDGGSGDGGQGDAGGGDAGAALDFSADVEPLFTLTGCTQCHFAGNQLAGGLNLVVGSAWSNLVNVAATCDTGTLRVAPGSPQQSQLWLKITADSSRCGQPMPPTSPGGLASYNPQAASIIQQWIQQGAPNN